jgi:hypothetical protein
VFKDGVILSDERNRNIISAAEELSRWAGEVDEQAA